MDTGKENRGQGDVPHEQLRHVSGDDHLDSSDPGVTYCPPGYAWGYSSTWVPVDGEAFPAAPGSLAFEMERCPETGRFVGKLDREKAE